MPGRMANAKRQQAQCCRVGCAKRPTRSIPSSLFCGARTKVCKACYTWMRRHFQVEPNGKHVRCAEAGILDRCAAMLEDFAKAGVYPALPARGNGLLVLPSTSRYCVENMIAREHAPDHAEHAPSVPVAPTAQSAGDTAARAQAAPPARASPPPFPGSHHQAGYAATAAAPRRPTTPHRPTPGMLPAAEWMEVGWDELSDSDSDGDDASLASELKPRELQLQQPPPAVHGNASDSDTDDESMAAPASEWDTSHDMDIDQMSMSTASSASAWRDLVVGDGSKSVDWALESEDYETLFATPFSPTGDLSQQRHRSQRGLHRHHGQRHPSRRHHHRHQQQQDQQQQRRRAQQQQQVVGGDRPYLPLDTMFPAGLSSSAPSRAVTPIRYPGVTLPPRPRAQPHATVRTSRANSGAGSVPCAPVGPSSTSAYAQHVHMAVCGSKCAHDAPSLAPLRPPVRVASTESLFSCSGSCGSPRDLHGKGSEGVVRKYGRRKASAGVSFAVAACGDCSPLDTHVTA